MKISGGDFLAQQSSPTQVFTPEDFSNEHRMVRQLAERFLRDEGLHYVGGSLRGGRARRIQYWPVSGRARQILLAPTESKIFVAERGQPVAKAEDVGALELF